MPRLVLTLLVLVCSALAAEQAVAQNLPAITVAVGKDPGDRQLIITGAELDSKAAGFDQDQPPRLWILGQSQPLAMTADAENTQRWTVNLPATLCKELRNALTIVYIEYGTMLAGPIGVPIDDLTPVAYAPDLKLETLPAAIHGTLTGDQTHSAVFTGKKGERVQVEIEARRLGGKLKPVIHLYDSRKVQLAWAQTMRTADGDARLSFVLPSDGDYRVEWHDALFKGEAPGTYRVKVGQYENVTQRYPLVIGSKDANSSETRWSDFYDDGSIRMINPDALDGHGPRAWPSMSHRLSGLLQAAEAQRDETTKWEHPANERRAVPLGLNGILAKPGEEDRWTIDVEPGKTLRFAVLAAQADSPVDAVLTLYDSAGKKQLMSADDAAKSADPTLEYTIPKGMNQLTVAIKDLLGRGGWEYVYNIQVTEAKAPAVTATWNELVAYSPQGSRVISKIKLNRQNYSGKLDFIPDPDSDKLAFSIAAGNTEELFLLPGGKFNIYYYFAQAREKEFSAAAPILHEPSPLNRSSVAIASNFAVISSDRETPFTLDWSAEPAQLPRGGEIKLPVKLTRTDKAKGPVRLSLLTNQPGQTKTIKERNQDKTVPAGEKMFRLAGKTELAADATEGSVTLQVPSDLAQEQYQLALRGELLSPDGKRVLAVTTTTIATPKTVYPLQIALETKLDPKKPADVRAGAGETLELVGKIERTAGAAGPVRVTVEGWPKDLPAPLVDLTAEQTEFKLPLRLPFKDAKAALKDVKLVAQAQPTPGPQTSGARAPALPLALRVVAGEKPAEKHGVVLFDEDNDFPGKLNSGLGKGEASLDPQSATRGKTALKFSPPLKGQPNLPGWNFKIRQNPGPGEYRYIRFTWKKQGAGPLGVQLAHDGKFGPTEKGGPSYRYHGGPGNTLGASLTITDNLASLKSQEVVRDLYADFGEFTLTGFGAVLGEKTSVAYFDELTLGQTLDDLE